MEPSPAALREVLERVGHSFDDESLLQRALTHRSVSGAANANNERFEFLGDAILDVAISELLMQRFPLATEGELSKRRAALVNAQSLAAQARTLGLGEALRLGKGEERSGGRTKDSILADAFEALLAAVHLDAGIDAARALVRRCFEEQLEREPIETTPDYKTELQEQLQRKGTSPPVYRLVEAAGPEHAPNFTMALEIEGEAVALGHGGSKKAAAQEAAGKVLRGDLKNDR